ncbi:MAG: Crp/Fnr family transcriptional regulator [Hyphomicrobiales bacterium]
MIGNNKDTSFKCFNIANHYPVFDMLSEKEQEKLAVASRVLKFKAGENIFKQGMPATSVFYIKEGLIKITKEGEQGQLNLNLLSSCNFLALATLGVVNDYIHSAYALVDSEVILMDTATLKHIMMLNAGFSNGMFRILSQEMVMLNERFYSLASKQMHGRMSDILLCLSKRIYKSNKFQLQLTRKDLGDLSGMAKESVVRVLKDLEKFKLIQVNNKNIEILDQEGLIDFSNRG